MVEFMLIVGSMILGLAVLGVIAATVGVDSRPGFDGRPFER